MGASALVVEVVIGAVVGGIVEAGCDTELQDSLYMNKKSRKKKLNNMPSKTLKDSASIVPEQMKPLLSLKFYSVKIAKQEMEQITAVRTSMRKKKCKL